MNNMNEPLITPQIYLSNLSDCKLGFWTKYHLEGSQWVIIGWPDRYLLCTNSADINSPGSYIVNVSSTEVYTYDNISFGVASANSIDNATWYFDDDSMGYGVLVNHSYKDDGNYTAYCVIDGDGGYAKFPIEITVLNRPPVPYIDAYRLVNVTLRVAGKKGNSVTMTLLEDNISVGQTTVTRQSGVPDEQSKTMVLKLRGNKTYQALLGYDGSNGGANPVKLIFTMDGNDDDCEDEEIEINFNSADGEYQEQIINIDSTLEELLEDNTMIIFNASESYDLDGYITDYAWDFGDGTNGTGMVVSHMYAVHGVYNVTLNITDDDYATNETVIPVELSIPTLLINQYPGVSILPSSGVNINWERLRGDWPMIDWWRPPRRFLRHYDNIWVEISTDNINWNTLSYYPGTGVKNSSNIVLDGWVHMEYDLSGYIGQNVSVRFRMKSDSSIIYEGAYIDDILINGTYIGEIPEPPSFNFYGEAWQGTNNSTSLFITIFPRRYYQLPSEVDEIQVEFTDENDNLQKTKTFTALPVGYGGLITLPLNSVNATQLNVSVNVDGKIQERIVIVDTIPEMIGSTSLTTKSASTLSPKSTKSDTEKVIFFDDMEGGTGLWETSGAVWIGNDFDQQTPYAYCLWHQTVGKYHSFNHSWAYNIEAVKNYNLKDYLNTTYGQQYFDDTGIWLGPLVRRHQGLLSTKQEIDLRLFKSANLPFWTWWDTEYGTRYDKKLVQVSSDHGSFETVFQISENNCLHKSWQKITVNLSAYCGHKIKIGFRFDTTDTKYNSKHEGWYVDDVKVTGIPVDWVCDAVSAPYPGLTQYVSSNEAEASINENGKGKVSTEPGAGREATARVGVADTEYKYYWLWNGTSHEGYVGLDFKLKGKIINGKEAGVSVGIQVFEYDENQDPLDTTEGVVWAQYSGDVDTHENSTAMVTVTWTKGHYYRVVGYVRAYSKTGWSGPESASRTNIDPSEFISINRYFSGGACT